MTAGLGRVPAPTISASISRWSRIYGFGSVYAKTLRDSRLTFIIMAGMLGGVMLAVGAAVGTDFATPASRQDLVKLVAELPPIAAGLAGKPINVGTLGGYVAWKYGPLFVYTAGLWSILALSGTLAGEARRGSLEFVAVSPFGKRRIALEKLAAHVTLMVGSVTILAVAAWVVGAAFGTQPDDTIPVQAAIGLALWVGLLGLASGAVAFALAPFVGRGSAAGVAGAILFGGSIMNGYQTAVPVFAVPANLTWFGWTANHIPLAGQYDWPSLVPVAVAAVVLFAIGVEAFTRRDIGSSTAIPIPGLPAAVLGLRGPVGRAFGERLPSAAAWGLGLGLFGLGGAAASRSLADSLAGMSPDTVQLFRDIVPNLDLTTAGGFLQFVFVQLGFIVVGFAAATLVAGWASDEGSGRLEMLLATPLARRSWAMSSSLGVLLAIALMTIVLAAGVGIGAVLAGSDAFTPMAGSAVLGLYAAALAGVGFAIGGLWRTSIAAEIVAVLVVATFLIDLLAPALKLPDGVHDLALTAHLGQPMVGRWDWVGMAACLVLAFGGLAISGWGVRRRDIRA